MSIVAVVFGGEAGEGGFLSLPVALAFDDEFEGSGLQTVDRGLGQQWVGHHGHHLRGLPVGGDDRGRVPVAFHESVRRSRWSRWRPAGAASTAIPVATFWWYLQSSALGGGIAPHGASLGRTAVDSQ